MVSRQIYFERPDPKTDPPELPIIRYGAVERIINYLKVVFVNGTTLITDYRHVKDRTHPIKEIITERGYAITINMENVLYITPIDAPDVNND